MEQSKRDAQLTSAARKAEVQVRIGGELHIDRGDTYEAKDGSARQNDYVRFSSYAACNSWLHDAIKGRRMTLEGDDRVLSYSTSTRRPGDTSIATGPTLLSRLANHFARDAALCKDVGIVVRRRVGRTWEFELVRLASPIPKSEPDPPPGDPLDGLLTHAEEILRVTGQIILQGPPGTGKTYAAKRLAARLLGIPADAVDEEENAATGRFHDVRYSEEPKGGCWELVQFHPAYAYDDFVRGIQAETVNSGITYKVVRRILDRLVEHHRPNATTVLIIDEINRANLAQVLGELIYALEYRGSPVQTSYQIKDIGTLAIPRGKFFIIGTMNTADRSIGRIDYAVRRRFAFLQLNPDREVILRQNTDIPQADKRWAAALFDSIATLFHSAEPRFLAQEFHPDDVQVGHTYFLGSRSDVKIKFAYQVCPLLREYYKDGVLLAENGKIELTLPGGDTLDLAQSVDPEKLLSKLD